MRKRIEIGLLAAIIITAMGLAPAYSQSPNPTTQSGGSFIEKPEFDRVPKRMLQLWANKPAHEWLPDFDKWRAEQPSFSPMVAGGSNAEQNRYPYMVWLALNGAHQCTGEVISPDKQWVVTAKHCQYSFNQVIVNDWTRNAPGSFVVSYDPLASTTIPHPTLDLLLLKISSKANAWILSRQPTPALFPADADLYGIGWGRTTETGSPSPQLKYATMKTLFAVMGSNTQQLFVKPSGGSESGAWCPGDSGGAAWKNGYLYGVVRSGTNQVTPCESSDWTGLAEMDAGWIASNTWPNHVFTPITPTSSK